MEESPPLSKGDLEGLKRLKPISKEYVEF